MPVVDFARYQFDPWEKYNQQKDYLLRKAALDEQTASRQQSGRLRQQEMGIQREQMAETSRRTDLMEQQENRISASEQREQARKQQEMMRNRYTVLANAVAQATPENYEGIKDYVIGMLSNEINSGPMSDEQKAEAIQQLNDAVPKEYDEQKIKNGISMFESDAKQNGFKTINLVSDDGSKTRIEVVPETSGYSPPAGWRIVDDFGDAMDMREKANQDAAHIKDILDIKKKEADLFRSRLSTALMDFKDPEVSLAQLFSAANGQPTDEYKNALAKARDFYSANEDKYDSLTTQEKRKFDSAKVAIEMHGQYIERLNQVQKKPSTRPPEEGKMKKGALQMTTERALEYLRKAGGDKAQAQKLAEKDGYTW